MSTYRTEVFEDGEPCWWCEREALRAELDTEAASLIPPWSPPWRRPNTTRTWR